VTLLKKSGSTWSSTEITLTDINSIDVKRGIGKIKDTFELKILNAENDYYKNGVSVIEEDDRIKIWIWEGETDWSDLTTVQQNACFQIDGSVTSVNQTLSTGRTLTVKGVGMMDVVFKGLVFVRDTSLTKPHLIIQNIIAQLNSYNPYRKIYGANPTEWGTTLTVRATTKRDGTTAFEDKAYTCSYKPAVEIIEDLSTNKYTGDGTYIFKVGYNPTESRYDFYWYAKETDTTDSLTEGTDIIHEINLKQSNEGIINAVIYHVGTDCNNNPRDFLAYDPTRQVADGASWRYYTETGDQIQALIENEWENNTASFATDSGGNRTSNYPTAYDNGGGKWTFQFDTRDDSGVPTGTKAEATDADDYNDAIVEEAKWAGRDIVMKVIDRWGESKWSGSITIPQSNSYTEGQLLKLTSESYNLSEYPLRVEEINQTIWDTTLKVKEDEKSIVLSSI